jgi:Ca2+/Na+ antiporter
MIQQPGSYIPLITLAVFFGLCITPCLLFMMDFYFGSPDGTFKNQGKSSYRRIRIFLVVLSLTILIILATSFPDVWWIIFFYLLWFVSIFLLSWHRNQTLNAFLSFKKYSEEESEKKTLQVKEVHRKGDNLVSSKNPEARPVSAQTQISIQNIHVENQKE